MDKLDGYIVKIDQEKAFYRVSHDYLFDVLDTFGFGPLFKKWITIFYCDIFSSVKCNGFLTNYFPIKNSVRQGCPISALLYVLSAEPLYHVMSSNTNIRGIIVPLSKKVVLMFQHADDTTLTLSDTNSVTEVLKVFNLYGNASGAKINAQKSEIMCIGSGCLSNDVKNDIEISEKM